MRLKLTNGWIDDASATPYRTGILQHDAELTFSIRFPSDDCADVQQRTDQLLSMMGRPVTVILDDAGGKVIVGYV